MCVTVVEQNRFPLVKRECGFVFVLFFVCEVPVQLFLDDCVFCQLLVDIVCGGIDFLLLVMQPTANVDVLVFGSLRRHFTIFVAVVEQNRFRLVKRPPLHHLPTPVVNLLIQQLRIFHVLFCRTIVSTHNHLHTRALILLVAKHVLHARVNTGKRLHQFTHIFAFHIVGGNWHHHPIMGFGVVFAVGAH